MFTRHSEQYNIHDINVHHLKDVCFHYKGANSNIFCIKLTKQQAIKSYLRFNIIKCNCCNKGKHEITTHIFIERANMVQLYGCGCDLNMWDVLEDILNS